VTIEVLVAIVLVCVGILLGTTWTTEALQPKLRRQADERRRLNEEWSAIRTARRQHGTCPRCASLLTERNRYIAPTIASDPPDDN
jgi:cell division protein FtsL